MFQLPTSNQLHEDIPGEMIFFFHTIYKSCIALEWKSKYGNTWRIFFIITGTWTLIIAIQRQQQRLQKMGKTLYDCWMGQYNYSKVF